MNKSKIAAFQPNGQWRDMYKFSVQLEDGTEGTAFSKSEQFRFGIGEEVEYVINDKGSLRLNKQQHFGKDLSQAAYVAAPAPTSAPSATKRHAPKVFTKDELIIRQVALKAAVDYGKDSGMEIVNVLKAAEQFNEWILGNAPQGHFDDEPF